MRAGLTNDRKGHKQMERREKKVSFSLTRLNMQWILVYCCKTHWDTWCRNSVGALSSSPLHREKTPPRRTHYQLHRESTPAVQQKR
jgi:hypothetical protein